MPSTTTLVARILAAIAAALAHGQAQRLALPQPLPGRSLTVPILMYHRVGPDPSGPAITRALTVSPGDFARQMEWLHASGFHAIRQRQLFDALERGARLPPSPIMITFDDGYRDVLWNAVPVLRRLHMPATMYVITGRIGDGDPSFLSWPELARLRAFGFDIGSHTVHHVELPSLMLGEAFAELRLSRWQLEQHLRSPVQWFAYPAGAFDSSIVRLVRRAGYLLAVTTRPGDVQSARQPFLLRRYEVLDTTGLAGLEALLGR